MPDLLFGVEPDTYPYCQWLSRSSCAQSNAVTTRNSRNPFYWRLSL